MNGNFYQNPTFPNNNLNSVNNQIYSNTNQDNVLDNNNFDKNETSYLENILRANKGKTVKAYFSFSDSEKWKDKEYFGTIEEAGLDHFIIKDSSNGSYYLLKMIYLDYVEFLEPINY